MKMYEYSHLMDIDEVVEYLNKKTERNFDQGKVIKFIEERNIPIVFEYKGWVTWEFRSEGKYQPHHKQLQGYFNIKNNVEAMLIFKGFLEKIVIERARIYRLNPLDIDSNPIDNLEPKEGDTISFKTGGRSPLFGHQNYIEIANNKVGVLKVDLQEHLDKKRTETMENGIKMEASESKIEKLESENAKLKSENANLRKQLEESRNELVDILADYNSELAIKPVNKIAISRSKDQKLIAIMAILLAEKFNKFQVGEKPNATQINDAVIELAQKLQIIDDDMFGLKGNTTKISKAIKAYLHIIKNKPDE